ncbi:DUF4262 domain-containing protein [Vibrio parahaemolyticus]|uniref:DUF4262 domain-containing protein n=1 Tax=Vibrio parahaemolyticus TaxID=670 RepID=UPI001123B8D0|nr:DUF4262 domain-containing protein [Vibrio parahaemolyticus]TOJ14054.1 hypothetical protein CGI45_18220 [Vibrio parahaemolyticus]
MTIYEIIHENIENYGWHMFGISPSRGDEYHNPFFYTVGLTDLDLPELILVGGMRSEHVHTIFTSIIDEWRQNGVKMGIQADFIADRDGNNLPIKIVELDNSDDLLRDEFAVQAFEYYKPFTTPKFAQILWPDMNGLLPGHPDFNMQDYTTILRQKTATLHA